MKREGKENEGSIKVGAASADLNGEKVERRR